MGLAFQYWSKSNIGYKKFNDHKVYERDKGDNFYIAKYIDKEIDEREPIDIKIDFFKTPNEDE